MSKEKDVFAELEPLLLSGSYEMQVKVKDRNFAMVI